MYKMNTVLSLAACVLAYTSAAMAEEQLDKVDICRVALPAIGKEGFVDSRGQWVIPPLYDDVKDFTEGLAAFSRNGRAGYLNSIGEEVISAKFEESSKFSEGLAAVKIDGYRGYINKSGKVVIPPIMTGYVGSFYEGLAWFERGGKVGFINPTEQTVIPPQFGLADNFSSGLAPILRDYKWGYINKSGQEIIARQFSSARSFSNGMAVVEINHKWGYIDKTGKAEIPLQFDRADDFSENMASIQKGDIWGYINNYGAVIIPPQFYSADKFIRGLAKVGLESKSGDVIYYGYINKSGDAVIKAKYSSLYHCQNGLFVAQERKDGAVLLLDGSGKRIVEFNKNEQERLERQNAKERAAREEKDKKEVVDLDEFIAKSTCKGLKNGDTMSYTNPTAPDAGTRRVKISKVYDVRNEARVRYLDPPTTFDMAHCGNLK